MKSDIVKKTRKQTIWILLLSILCLILISFFPWISVAEKDRVKEDLHFSYEMMKSSDNTQIRDLAGKLSHINILFWAITIVALISFLFITYHALSKSSLLGQLMMIIIGCVTLILSVLIVYFQIIFSRSINDMDTLSASMIFSPFAYAYIPFIISIILLIYSATYTVTIFAYTIKQLISSPKQKKKKIKKIDEKKTPKKLDKKEMEVPTKEPTINKTLLTSKTADKRSEMEKWLADEAQSIDEQTVEEELLEPDLETEETIQPLSKEKTFDVKEKEPEEYEKSKETIIKEDEESIEPLPSEKPKEKSEKTDEARLSRPFEEALSSAIEKRQSEKEMQRLSEPEEKDVKKDETVEPEVKEIEELKPEPIFQTEKISLEKEGGTIKKIVNVRCPRCNHIFSFDKEDDTQNITCPKCGKEGTVKNEF